MDFYGFYTGTEFDAHHYLGTHCQPEGVVFRTFAPNAQKISIIGDFNGWQETEMAKTYNGQFWECCIPEAKRGQRYKFRIYHRDGSFMDHCDPYGFLMDLRPDCSSIIWDSQYEMKDSRWISNRKDTKNQPLNIYEAHLGSWMQKDGDKLEQRWYTYGELADRIIPYLKEHGYNYLEIMPLNEHPSDESWGYQSTGFFAPTSRYGTPDDLKRLIEQCHQNEIGVILDFVPVHFAIDKYALADYDGTALFEYPHQDVGQSEWGSCNFMHSRGEVRSFLQSSAKYWLEEFHFDGLRMDAVSNLIYWQGHKDRGQNNGAIQFLQNMNQGIKQRYPYALLIAEDSSDYLGVTTPVEHGGLGFDYKWDMGWMNDTLYYFSQDTAFRRENYHKLTFSMFYFKNERYLLSLSHDEVVHCKGTILQKMYGSQEDKLAQARCLYMYMYAHPGKKLNFMDNELAQLREWNESRQLDWHLLNDPVHSGFLQFMSHLNNVYTAHDGLWEKDYDPEGFWWLDCHQEQRCIYAMERKSDRERILALFNFSDAPQYGYSLNIQGQKLVPLCFSDASQHSPVSQGAPVSIVDGKAALDLPRYSAYLYQIVD